jgi:hypothetical protein
MRKDFKDAELHCEYKNLTGEDPDPLIPEEMEKTNREMPRDAEVIDLLKKFPTKARFLRDNCKDGARRKPASHSSEGES